MALRDKKSIIDNKNQFWDSLFYDGLLKTSLFGFFYCFIILSCIRRYISLSFCIFLLVNKIISIQWLKDTMWNFRGAWFIFLTIQLKLIFWTKECILLQKQIFLDFFKMAIFTRDLLHV